MSPRASARTTTTGAPPHPVDEILPARRLVPAALQHVAGMYAGLTAPPLIIGGALGLTPGQLSTLIAAAFLVAGIGTAAQALGVFGVGARLPLTNGVSFAVASPVLATVAADGRDGALPAVFGATLVAGVLCLLLAPAFCRLVRFFPPVVSGCVITLVGISLLPVASVWARGGDPRAADYAAPSNLALAAATLAVTLAIHRMLSGRFLGRIAVLLGMFAGTLLAVPLGKVDLDPLTQAPLFALPEPFVFGAPRFVPTVIATAVVVMLVSMMESTASLLALAAVTGRPAQDRTITGSLRAQGLATALGGVLGSFTSTAYAQNVGLVALSRIRSRYVVALCGAVLVLMGLVPVLGSLVALVPMPVLGGAGVVFFGSVAVAGIRTLAKASLGTGHNAVTVSVTLAFGLFPLVSPGFYDRLPDPAATILESGVTAGCLVAVLLNYLLNHLGRGTEADPDTVTAEQIRGLDGAGGTRGTPHPGTAGVPFPHAAAGSPPPLPHRTPTGPPAAVDRQPYAAVDRHPYAAATGSPDAAPHAPGTYDASLPAPGTYDAASPAPGTYDAAVHTSVSPAPAEAAASTGVTFPGPLHPLHDRSRRPHPQRDRTPAPAPYPQPPDPAAPASGQPW